MYFWHFSDENSELVQIILTDGTISAAELIYSWCKLRFPAAVFSFSHRWQWGVGSWRGHPLTVHWQPVRCLIRLSAACWWVFSLHGMIYLKDEAEIYIFQSGHPVFFFSAHFCVVAPLSRPPQSRRRVSTLYVLVFLKWEQRGEKAPNKYLQPPL